MLKHFDEPNGNRNAPGHHIFYFNDAALFDSDSFIFSDKQTVSEIVSMPNLYKGYAATNTLDCNYEPEDTPDGLIYPVTVKGLMPYNTPENLRLMQLLYNTRCIVFVVDNNNRIKLCGMPGKLGMRFTYKQAASGFEFQFFNTYPSPPLFYTGDITTI